MCEPLTIGALALTAAGTIMAQRGATASAQAASDAYARDTNARTQILNQSQTQQDQLKQPALDAVAQQTQAQGADAQAKTLADAINARQQQYLQATSPITQQGPSDALPTSSDAPKVIKDQLGTTLAGVSDRIKQQAASKAALTGFGDAQIGNQISLNRSGQSVDMANNFRAGAMGILPYRLNAASAGLQSGLLGAQKVGLGDRQVGSLLTGVGTAAAGGAGMGKGPSWSDVFGSSTPGVTNLPPNPTMY